MILPHMISPMKITIRGITLIFFLLGNVVPQTRHPDISDIAAAGRVSNSEYTNSLLKLSVNAPNATLQANPLVDKEGQRARLVQIFSKPATWDDTYTFAVLADTLARYPHLESSEEYVRSVRHQLEREGLVTLREEFPITIDDVRFTGAIMQEQTPDGRKYCRGLYTTFRNGLILSFDAEAATQGKLNDLVKRSVRFDR